jgi:uncharacterized protein YggE
MKRSVRLAFVLCAAFWLLQQSQIARAQPGSPPRSIEASGTASISADPDRARLTVSVSSTAPAAKEATEATARKMKEVVSVLKEKVGADGKVETTSYSVHAEYSYENRGNARHRKLEGYTATNTVSAETATLDAMGTLIDSAVGAGANQINSVGFFLADDSEIRRRALIQAGKNARAEGAAIAESLQVELGPVLHATTSPGFDGPRPMALRSAAMSAAEAVPATEILPGAVKVRASVRVSFEIR